MRTKIITIVLFLGWWFIAAEWVTNGGKWNAEILFFVISIPATWLHIKAFKEFDRQLKATHKAEAAGLGEPGVSLFAENQRFRYTVRSLESLYLLALIAAGAYAIYNPTFAANKIYGKAVMTYFVGTIVATAYLTVRDLAVQKRIKQIDEGAEASTLVPMHSREK